MAAMEKISYPPLIEELKTNSALYNQWYNESEMKFGNLPSETIVSWIVEVVEPLVMSTVAINSATEKVHQVVKALYLESLKLIGSGLAIRYKDEYASAWLLMTKTPNLILKFPIKTISLLNDVLLNLNRYAPEKTMEWCILMEVTSTEIKTIEDFKTVGRIFAWKCGLAHLRNRLQDDFNVLTENLQHTITTTLGFDHKTNQIFGSPWSTNRIDFKGVQGGFEGTNGYFESPPKLSLIDEHILVTDSKNSYAFFADQFGKVLIPAPKVNASHILSKSKRFASLEKWLGKEHSKVESSNVSSMVATKDTLVFTLNNSYFIYLYSLANA